jgi:WD40 repeat protein
VDEGDAAPMSLEVIGSGTRMRFIKIITSTIIIIFFEIILTVSPSILINLLILTRLVSGSDDATIKIWNTSSWTCEKIIKVHQDEIWAMRGIGEDRLVSGSVDGTLRCWKYTSRDIEDTDSNLSVSSMLGEHDNNEHESTETPITTTIVAASASASTSVSASTTAAGAGNISTIYDWECEAILTSSSGPVYAVISLGDLVVSAGSGSKISVWNSTEWKLHRCFDTTEAPGVWALTVCKGRLVSGGADGSLRVWI